MNHWTSLSYAVVDVEGNGQQPPDLVEFAVVPIVGGKIGEPQSWLVRPERSIKYFATRVHGLANDDVARQAAAPEQPGYQLGMLVRALNLAEGLPDGLTPHRATYDVLVTARLFVHLATSIDSQPLSLEALRSKPVQGGDDEAQVLF